MRLACRRTTKSNKSALVASKKPTSGEESVRGRALTSKTYGMGLIHISAGRPAVTQATESAPAPGSHSTAGETARRRGTGTKGSSSEDGAGGQRQRKEHRQRKAAGRRGAGEGGVEELTSHAARRDGIEAPAGGMTERAATAILCFRAGLGSGEGRGEWRRQWSLGEEWRGGTEKEGRKEGRCACGLFTWVARVRWGALSLQGQSPVQVGTITPCLGVIIF
jgi:hypothetical protein